jgi:hypothetical protein
LNHIFIHLQGLVCGYFTASPIVSVSAQRCVPTIRLSSAITDQLTLALPIQLIILAVRKKCVHPSLVVASPLCPSLGSYSSRAGHTLRAGNNAPAEVHTKCSGLPVLQGGTHRTQIWTCLKHVQFSFRGREADTKVHIGCTCAQQHSCAHW